MMRKILFFLIILLTPIWVYCQKTVVKKLGNIAQITFPEIPNSKSSNTNDSGFTVKYQSDIYVIQVHDFSRDSTFSLDSADLQNKYNELINGAVEFSHGKLIYKKNILICGFKGVEFKFKATFYDSTYTCYHRILYINRTIYNYGFWTQKDDKNYTNSKRDNFFNSFVLTKNKSALFQYYTKSNSIDFWSTTFGKIIIGVLKCIIAFVFLYYLAKGFPFQVKNKNL